MNPEASRGTRKKRLLRRIEQNLARIKYSFNINKLRVFCLTFNKSEIFFYIRQTLMLKLCKKTRQDQAEIAIGSTHGANLKTNGP